MNLKPTLMAASVALVIFGTMRGHANDPQTPKSPEEIAVELAAELSNDSFAARRAAAHRLTEMGEAAFDALMETAVDGGIEARTRAIDILAGHLNSDDAGIKTAARRSLHRIAASDNRDANRLAEQALDGGKPKPQVDAAPAAAPLAWGPAFGPMIPPLPQMGLRPPLGALRNAFPAPLPPGPGFRRVRIRVVNGVKNIEAHDDGKVVKIHETPAGGINIEVTEGEEDAETTHKYQADSAEQLKEKSPEGYQIYQQYAQNTRAANAGMDAPQRMARPGHNAHFDRIQEHLDGVIERTQSRLEDAGDVHAEHLRRMIEHLRQHKQRIEEQRQRFGNAQPQPAA